MQEVTIVNASGGGGASFVLPAFFRTVGGYGRDAWEAGVTGFHPDMTIMNATDIITVVEGYDAMRIFLETVRRRRGDAAGQIELVIGGLKWADGTPVDPTMWEDWLAAVQTACICRTR